MLVPARPTRGGEIIAEEDHTATLYYPKLFLAADDSKNFKILKYKDDRLGGKSLIQRRGSDPMNERYLCRQHDADLVMV